LTKVDYGSECVKCGNVPENTPGMEVLVYDIEFIKEILKPASSKIKLPLTFFDTRSFYNFFPFFWI